MKSAAESHPQPFLPARWRALEQRWPFLKRLRQFLCGFWRLLLLLLPLFLCGLLVLVWQRSHLESPAPTYLLLDRHGRFLADEGQGPLGFWPVEPLPKRVVAATLTLEDRHFWQHPGVDVGAILRAAYDNLRLGRRVSGASTLAMQVARLQHPGTRTLWRKGLEALTAVALTLRHGREQLLRHYLQRVPYGNRFHGIAYAARRYLDKPVEDLSWAETAFLTALPQAPARMNPFTSEGRTHAQARAKRILLALEREGWLNKAELQLALHELESLRLLPLTPRPTESLHFVLGVKARLPELRRMQPRVQTTLDLSLQQRLASVLLREVQALAGQGVGNAALLVVDAHSGEVRVQLGSTDYFDDAHHGAIDYTRVPRLAGSTLKPFLYAEALQRGLLTPTSLLADLARGPEGVENMDRRYLGPLRPRVALANSRNIPALELLRGLGLETGYGLLRRLALADASVRAEQHGMGPAIGGIPVTLEQLVQAYTTFTSQPARTTHEGTLDPLASSRAGSLTPLRYWQPIEQEMSSLRPRPVFDPAVAQLLTVWLSDPLARLPTFPRLGFTEFPFPVAIKTGTSSQYRDAWAVAWSQSYLVGVWLGQPDFQPMHQVTGYTGAGRVLAAVMRQLHADQQDGLADGSFPPPRGYVSVRVCGLSGKAAGPACDQVVPEFVPPSLLPLEDCSFHVRTRGREGVKLRLPPEYQSWAQSMKLPLLDAVENSPATQEQRLDRPVKLTVLSPRVGGRLRRDPSLPENAATLSLKALVEPVLPQLLWYVDGEPYRMVSHPYETRWTLEPGRHHFQVGVPGTPLRSSRVWVEVLP